MRKKELVAVRDSEGSLVEDIGVRIAIFGVALLPSSMLGLILSLVASALTTGDIGYTLNWLIPMSFTFALIGSVIYEYDVNKKYLYSSKYAGKEIGKERIENDLTLKGKISCLPLVGKVIKPQNILSANSPYAYTSYMTTHEAKKLERKPVKDPMVSWDALMQSELGVTVPEALNA